MHLRFFHIVSALLVLLVGCKDKPEGEVEDNFDKEVMLTNMADNLIVPAYDEWKNNIEELKLLTTDFKSAPSESSLIEVQTTFIEAYKSWNRCSVYEFGPAADKGLRLKVNIFRADTTQIEANVASESIEFGTPQNAEAIGFAAIDYLLFSKETSLLTDSKRQEHLLAQIDWVETLAAEVSTEWTNYQDDFIANTNSSAGSPLSNLVNEINYEFELFKNARIGIPLGKKTLGITQAHKLEAVYSNRSEDLALENIIGIRTAFTGGLGQGLDDYLDDLKATKDGQDLSKLIMDLFVQIESELQATDLDEAIKNEPSSLDPMYNHIEQLVVLLKVDMPSQLGVQITYQDNDGD